MDLSDLRIFVAVVEEGSITGAARRLHRVQSNVTTRIRQLEADLQTDLFIRRNKRLILAPAGRTLLDYARRLLALADEAEGMVRDQRPNGLFRLGAMESTAAVRLPGPIAAYNRTYPDVTLELRTGNPLQLAAALRGGEIDAALFAEPVADETLEHTVAFEEEPVIITGGDHPPIDATSGVPETMLVFEQGCPHRRRMEVWYEARGQRPRRTIELGSYHALMGCVLAGMGAALLPKSVLSTFPKQDSLKVHDLPKGADRIATLLVWRKNGQTPNVKAFLDVLAA